ncbi:serine protease inhibitor A3N-like protein, partial [Leptotrombidium deliense]
MAFSMIMLGAKNTTETELFNGLSMNETMQNASEVKFAFEHLLKSLNNSAHVANQLLVQQQYNVLKEYNETAINFYNSTVREVDFKDPNLVNEINDWVSKQTDDFIKELVKEFDEMTTLVVLNAIAFKGEWSKKFDPSSTKKGTFHNGNKNNKENDNP